MKNLLSFASLLITANIYLECLIAPSHRALGVFHSYADDALQKTSTPPIVMLPL